jgi:hypothetical protein
MAVPASRFRGIGPQRNRTVRFQQKQIAWSRGASVAKAPVVRKRIVAASGFTLLEALIGATIVVVGVFALIHLLLLSARATVGARNATFTSLLASEKMEQLRALTWGFDAAGGPTSDVASDLTSSPERSSGGTGLSPSPAAALSENTDGYCDFLDGRGRSLGTGSTPPGGTVYVRRWAITPLPASSDTLILAVRVVPRATALFGSAGSGRLSDESILLGIKTRKES